MVEGRKGDINNDMTNQIGFKEQDQELNLSSTVDAARMLVFTIRDLSERLKILEDQVQYLKQKEEHRERHG